MYVSALEMRILRILARERQVPALVDLCEELGEVDRLKVERALRRVDAFAYRLAAGAPPTSLYGGRDLN